MGNSMLGKVAGLFIGIVLSLMGVQAFFVGGYWSESWGRYMDYGPVHQLTGVVFIVGGFIVLGFTLFRDRKRQFRSIKKKYGIINDKLCNTELVTGLLLRFNQMVETPLGFYEYTVIKLDGASLLLLYGNVAYTSSWWVGITTDFRTAVYSIAENGEASNVLRKYEDIFEFGTRKGDMTLYWVRNLKKLDSFLREHEKLNSVRPN